ncbi:hypothetical protein KBY58_03455 [Cyanobium sp. HWJ4-Hawea]|uniref:bifunctional heptose 7-phosphate kinase/heptose 1-phosphate adenyltransferase n=1 Tax=Cyanobium sp. HWJ4-Hawea TaxID=2823713 RepID=UPI0020CBA812|nr:PfkB family carbohydrate kinase [Cyanobium sp. HWJ4-Hawea]MCP9808488.1 hypothetical protein [Cyanobium sp. HWJ4-Hawea]
MKKVVLLGDGMIDVYHRCEVTRIAPEGPFPVLNELSSDYMLGGSFNVARQLLTFGFEVAPLVVLHDHQTFFKKYRLSSFREAQNYSKSLEFLFDSDIVSIKHRFTSLDKIIARWDIDSVAIPDHYDDLIISAVFEFKPDLIVFSDYNKGSLSDFLIKSVLSYASISNIITLVDPKPRADLGVYRGADVITPNLIEANLLMKSLGYLQNLDCSTILAILRDDLQIKRPVITLGSQGICCLNEFGDFVHSPVLQKDLFDVTGAGDAVISTLCYCLANDISLVDALAYANKAGGAVVGHLGNYCLSLEDIL